MASWDARSAVIGGGVVGCAVARALARRGLGGLLLEAEPGLALGASGTNSGILHTGFDSLPGELETRLILRSAELRGELEALGVEVWRCGARLRPEGEQERSAVSELARNAAVNGVEARLESDGSLHVPGESVTDPVDLVHALAADASADGATIRLGAQVVGLGQAPEGGIAVELGDGERLRVPMAVNCAGLHADEVARMAGEDLLTVYPRKGEFLVLENPPADPLLEILLPVPSAMGKGVLVFPTLDGRVIAGPTAREREDKRDWSVEDDAVDLIIPKAVRMYPPLEGAEPIDAYAGLRPAGRGCNYVIAPSRTLQGMVHAAAIRSTGLSAAIGIAEHIADMLAPAAPDGRPPGRGAFIRPPRREAWWRRAAEHRAGRPIP